MSGLGQLPPALLWTERLTALAVALQTLELISLRRAWSDTGIWRWALLAPEHEGLPALLRWAFARLLPERPFAVLLWLRLLAALVLGGGTGHGALCLLATQVAIGVRFRGTFNGGSDGLSVVLLSALSLSQALPDSDSARKAALLYIALQVTLSYFVAGVTKVRHADWRSGRALGCFITRQEYGAPRWVMRALRSPTRRAVLSCAVLAFECGFPLAWSGPNMGAAFVALGLGFHLGTWLLFGLNRFVFAWAATYPALLWCSSLSL